MDPDAPPPGVRPPGGTVVIRVSDAPPAIVAEESSAVAIDGQAVPRAYASSAPPAASVQPHPRTSVVHQRLEAVPPTVREPVPPTIRAGGGRGRIIASWIAGAVLVILGALLAGRLMLGKSDSPTPRPSGPPQVGAAPLLPNGSQSAGVAVSQGVAVDGGATLPADAVADACKVSLAASLADDCARALKYRKLCPETHPNHRDAHVTYDLHCKQ